ncbi:MAG: heavy-metal-associated domain-containing protein [Flavobacteriales bacterium]|nr:heavy-metal-associated domain-containing protein [Flavobacteriales bacterium]
MGTKSVLFTSMLVLLFSCQQVDRNLTEGVSDPIRTESEIIITSGTPVTMADLSIEGMSCEMMCGGAIKKALASLPGVHSSMIDFSEGTDVADHAIVTYDPSQVSDAQMVEAIHKIHDGQYKVMAVKVTRQVLGEAPVDEAVESEDASQVNASLPRMLVPSIIRLLSQVLRT